MKEKNMETKLTEFLLSMGEDPQKIIAWQENPDSVLEETDLTPTEKALIKSGNAGMISAAIAEELAGVTEPLAEVLAWRSDLRGASPIFRTIGWLAPIRGFGLFLLIDFPNRRITDNQYMTEIMTQLRVAIESEPNLKAEDQAEALEQVEVLAEALKNPEAMRRKAGTAIKILRGTIAVLPSTANLVAKTNQLLPVIAQQLALG